MDTLKEYEKDLKSISEIEEMLKFDLADNITISQVYLFINKLNLIYYYINVYDKYYSALSTINKEKNHQIKNIIRLYDNYDILYSNFIEKVCNTFCIKEFKNQKSLPFIIKMFNEAEHLPTDKKLYSKLYKCSEHIYNEINNNIFTKEEKIELIKKYVEMKEKMATLKKYDSFLEQKLSEIGIKKETFINLINCDFEKVKTNQQEHVNKNNFKDLFAKCSIDYLDNDIVTKLSDKIIKNVKSYVLSSYKKTPIIFMNYTNDLRDISKLFHEIAHAYHYVVASNNELINYNPNQFISEMFAMTNQIIILDYINTEESGNLKREDYNNFLIDAIYTLKFEYYIHSNYKNLNLDDLNKYYSNFEKYINYVFNDYYDLNYSFGFICATILADKIKRKEVEKTEIDNMLKSNIDLNANQILKKINIDLDNLDFISIIENIINKVSDKNV